MEIDLVEPKPILRIEPAASGGWLCELGCGHIVWHPKAQRKQMPCGVCAQRLIRQIHQIVAEQSPPPYARKEPLHASGK